MRRTLYGLPVLDVSLAATLAVVRLVTLVAGIQPGGGVVSYVAALLLTLPLAWRSRCPLGVACVVMGTAIVEVALVGYHDSVVVLAVYIIVPYSVAAHCDSVRRMAAGLGVTVAAGVVAQTAQSTSSSSVAADVAGGAAVILVPFFAGLAMRQQRLRAQALERLARQLEHEREERARTAVAEERARIARELHDEVAHAMSVIAVQADAAEGALAHDPALVPQPLVAIRDTARQALGDMRRVLGGLRDGEHARLAPEPGLARLGTLLDQARSSGLEVELRVEGEPALLSPPVDLAAYRVAQEALTNVRKHAGACKVELVVRYNRDTIVVEVSDDGDASGEGGGSGRGLAGIRERVSLLGGEFVAGPRSRGFAVHVTLPRV